jgi:hypothetical protein
VGNGEWEIIDWVLCKRLLIRCRELLVQTERVWTRIETSELDFSRKANGSIIVLVEEVIDEQLIWREQVLRVRCLWSTIECIGIHHVVTDQLVVVVVYDAGVGSG